LYGTRDFSDGIQAAHHIVARQRRNEGAESNPDRRVDESGPNDTGELRIEGISREADPHPTEMPGAENYRAGHVDEIPPLQNLGFGSSREV